MNTIKNSHDYNRGIRKYLENIYGCKVCKQPCNTFWQSEFIDIKPSFTCCQKCANIFSGVVELDIH